MPIIIAKPNTISPEIRKELKDAGYIVIETSDPKDITILDKFTTAGKDIVLHAALQSLDWGNDPTCRNAFGKLFREKLMKKLSVEPISDKK